MLKLKDGQCKPSPFALKMFDVRLRRGSVSRGIRAVVGPHKREAVALGSSVEGEVNDLVRLNESADGLESVLVQIWSSPVRIHEVDGAVRSQEEMSLDIGITGHVKGGANADLAFREVVEQCLVEGGNDFSLISDDDRRLHAVADDDLRTMKNVHENSLTGYGAHCACAPIATTEAATSVVGDIVRDGADMTPGFVPSPVEKSAATGAADASALADRPHPVNRPEWGAP